MKALEHPGGRGASESAKNPEESTESRDSEAVRNPSDSSAPDPATPSQRPAKERLTCRRKAPAWPV